MSDKTLRPSWAIVREVLSKGFRFEDGKLIAPGGTWALCEPVGRDPGPGLTSIDDTGEKP